MKVGITGIKGRVGRMLAHEIINNNILDLSSALVRDGYDEVGMDIGDFLKVKKLNTHITDDKRKLFNLSDVVVDFSSQELTMQLAKIASEEHKTLISGTKDLSEENLELMKQYSHSCRILYSNNMSIAYNLLVNLVNRASCFLNDDFNISIINSNNGLIKRNYEENINSIAKSIASGKGWEFGNVLKNTDNRNKERTNGRVINIANTSTLNKIEESSVVFSSISEELKVEYNITNDFAFIRGVLKAVFWLDDREYGFYTMGDVLEL